MALRFKEGVRIDKLTGSLSTALHVAADVWWEMEKKDCIVTSGNDGVHGPGNLHEGGRAADLRISNLNNPSKMADALRARLPKHFDIVLEVDHIHIEDDPKK